MKTKTIFNNHSLLAVAALLAGAMCARAESPPTLTLNDAVRLALAHNPALLAARHRVEAEKGRATQAQLWSNPELELSAEDMPTRRMGFSDSKNLVGISQTVPFPGKKFLDRQIGRMGVHATESDLRAGAAELARAVKTAFYRVLAAERRRDITAQLVQLAEWLADTARRRVEAGATAAQEQLRAEIEAERAKTEFAAVGAEAVEARQTLAALIGKPELRDAPVAGALPEIVMPESVARTREQLWRTHPRLASATAARDRAELQLRRAKLEPWPDMKVGFAGGHEADAGGVVEFRVSVPLPLWDRSQGKTREARANAAIAEADLTATEHELLKEWNATEARFRAAADQVTAYRDRILPKAEEALRLVRSGFERGKFGFIDLLDTQRTTAEVRLAYQQKLVEMNSALAELEALAGAPTTTNPTWPPPKTQQQ